MTDKPAYIIDSNILIESKNLDYGFDICPGFWELMRKLQARFCLDPEHSFEQQRHSS